MNRKPRRRTQRNSRALPPLPHPSWFGDYDRGARIEPSHFWAKLGL